MTVVARFEIEHRACLAPDGTPLGDLPAFARDRATLVALYRWMVLTRAFDAKAVALQRTGRLGTYASSLGQEAVAIGLAHPMVAGDVLLPSFREHGAQLMRGVAMTELFLYWGGDERGSDFAGPRRDFPVCIPIGSHAPHAAGVALALKLRREPHAALAVFGDGATSKGDVYEAMNLAGAWALPLVFVVGNNQWAISVPRKAQTGARTLAQKGLAGGLDCVQVDGNDLIAVRAAMDHALKRARTGHGGSVIELVTYRLADHTTADDARRYRDDAEVKAGWEREPMSRLRTFLVNEGMWSETEEAAWKEECGKRVDEEVNAYLETKVQPVEAMFDYLYAELPADLAAQRADAIKWEGR